MSKNTQKQSVSFITIVLIILIGSIFFFRGAENTGQAIFGRGGAFRFGGAGPQGGAAPQAPQAPQEPGATPAPQQPGDPLLECVDAEYRILARCLKNCDSAPSAGARVSCKDDCVEDHQSGLHRCIEQHRDRSGDI